MKGQGAPLKGPRAVIVPALAGIINVFVSSPIFVVSTRMRAAPHGRYRHPIACVHEILQVEGARAMWSGLVPSLWLVSNPTVQHFSYERLKLLSRARTSMQFFLVGAVAKAIATLTTYPLQVRGPSHPPPPRALPRPVVHRRLAGCHRCAHRRRAPLLAQVAQTLLRTQQRSLAPAAAAPDGACARAPYRGVLDCLRRLLAEEGVPGLYRGLQSKLAHTVLTAALMFALYERLARRTFRLLGVKDQARI